MDKSYLLFELGLFNLRLNAKLHALVLLILLTW